MLHHPLSRLFALAVRVPPLLFLDPRVDVDVLGLLEGFEALPAELPADAAAAVDELRPPLEGLADVVFDLPAALRVDHAPYVGLLVHRVADFQRPRELL